jgi:hypothetical protein
VRCFSFDDVAVHRAIGEEFTAEARAEPSDPVFTGFASWARTLSHALALFVSSSPMLFASQLPPAQSQLSSSCASSTQLFADPFMNPEPDLFIEVPIYSAAVPHVTAYHNIAAHAPHTAHAGNSMNLK